MLYSSNILINPSAPATFKEIINFSIIKNRFNEMHNIFINKPLIVVLSLFKLITCSDIRQYGVV